jgi:hypothetical protein
MSLDQKRYFESGKKAERERIIKLLTDFKTQFGTGWGTVYSDGFASGIAECIAAVRGENE